jgi:heme/copper-type cytochrome/quinol oxidase subunit 2
MRRTILAAALGTAALLAAFGAAFGASAQPVGDPAVVRMTLRDHRFAPDTVVAPAGRPIRLEIVNEDAAPEKIESPELGVAQDLMAGGRAGLTLGPLKPGRYALRGELHADTAAGTLEVVEGQ